MKKIIIIGSGIGGLVAGSLLAKKGHKVTIFESHSMPGGYTAGFFRKGFYFESGTLCFENSESIFKAMKDIGVFGKIDFVRTKLRVVCDNFDGIPANYNDYKKLVYSGFPAEKEKLDGAFSELDQIAGELGGEIKPIPYLYSGFKKLAVILPYIKSTPKLMKLTKKYGNMTSTDFAVRHFEKDSKLYKLYSGFSYTDMSAMLLGSGLSGIFTELWTVNGGMQTWADILADNFRKLGGELKLRSYVDRIITKNGIAVGVSYKDIVYNADYVISAGDYKKTLLKLLDNKSLVPQEMQERIENAPVSDGYFTVYLGLNTSNEELKSYMQVPHAIYYSCRPDRDIYDSLDSEFFTKTTVEIYSPSMMNQKLAPAGKSSLMIQAKAPYHWMDNWGGGDRKTYLQLKEKAMGEMIESASRLIPGLKNRIEYKDAATPLTYERFTHNTDGASTAWSWNPKKSFYKSGISVNIKTPVKNLLIGSCWALQIGGVPGALYAAYLCAQKIK